MPRDGAIIFSDLIGKLDLIRVACDKCGRDGCCGLARLIDKRGRDAKVIDWLDELTADCPKKIAHNIVGLLHRPTVGLTDTHGPLRLVYVRNALTYAELSSH